MKRILKLKQPNYLHKDPNGHLLGSLYPFRPDIYCKDCDKFYKKIDMLKLNPKTMLPARVYRMRKIDIEQRRLAKIERKIQREGSNISKMIKSLATPLIEKEQVMLSK